MFLPVSLFVPFAAMLIFVAFIFCWERRRQTLASGVARPRVDEPFTVLSISGAFDPDHAIIWDTQIPALQLIASAGGEGLPIEALYPFYRDSTRHYPELYDGCSFESWLEFLRQTQLVSVGFYRLLLMPDGQEFLRYRLGSEVSVAAASPTQQHGAHWWQRERSRLV